MASERLWGVKLVALVVGLLVMVPDTMQLSVFHPLYSVVQRINDANGPFLGIVVSSQGDVQRLLDSGYFVPSPSNPSITVAGREFHIGKFKGVPAITVVAGKPLGAVGATVQILIDTFRLKGIINYGGGGAVGDKVSVGDVAVVNSVAYTGVWKWQRLEKEESTKGVYLRFGDYNMPEPGENSLARVDFQPTLSPATGKQIMWYPAHPEWSSMASKLKELELDTIGSEPRKVVFGTKGSTSDIHVDNKAYADFLHKELQVSVVDKESAAVVQAAMANDLPYIVFRSPSNRPGDEYDEASHKLAGQNVLKVVAAFVQRLSLLHARTNNFY